MTQVASVAEYTAEFVWRRRRNWLPIFMLYGAFYMCRYNMSVAKMDIGLQYGWSKTVIGSMLSAWAISYALGQFINGQVADRYGGRRMMFIGALGTGAANVALGLVAGLGSLSLFTAIWAFSGYFQAMGAPSFVKINSTWFGLSERGVFTGIFGICTQIGTALALSMTGYLVVVAYWRWAFIVPGLICIAYAFVLLFNVRETPEDLGLRSVDTGEDPDDSGVAGMAYTLRKVFTSRAILTVSFGYLCLGVVRYGLFFWYPDYLREVHHIGPSSPSFQIISWGLPFAGMAGALSAGFLSDRVFATRRAPVVVLMYGGQAVVMVVFYLIAGPVISGLLFVFLSFFVNGPHSLLGGAASMDFGGRKAAASAAGIIDAFQYLGMFVITFFGGRIVDTWGWNGWVISLIATSVIGAAILATLWNARAGTKGAH